MWKHFNARNHIITRTASVDICCMHLNKMKIKQIENFNLMVTLFNASIENLNVTMYLNGDNFLEL